jgi:hypothetical protein
VGRRGAQDPDASVHTGGAAAQPTNHGRTLVRERILDTHGQAQDGDARNVINARWTGNTETRATAGYHLPHDEFSSMLPPAHVNRPVHGGDGPPCMAQRLPPGVPAGRSHH